MTDKVAVFENPTNRRLAFRCPACKCGHYVQVEIKNGRQGPLWTWNGSLTEPTFNPSILVTYGESHPPDRPARCHSFVRGGRIEFCADSTHALAGKTVELPPW